MEQKAAHVMVHHFSKKEVSVFLARRAFSMLSKVGVPRGKSNRLLSDAMTLSASSAGTTKNTSQRRIISLDNIALDCIYWHVKCMFCDAKYKKLGNHTDHEKVVWGIVELYNVLDGGQLKALPLIR